ncbi:hypothetical protein D3C77_194130 [compost metagenome]
MSHDLNAALLDVRRAYRLLANYQKRQFDLLSYIRNKLDAVPYYQDYVFARQGDLRGLENQANAGLRFLPFLDISAIWLRHQNQEKFWDEHLPGDLMFGAWVRSDTGFDKYQGIYTEKTAEASRSVLVLSVVICDEPNDNPGNWFNKVWNSLPYPEDGEVGNSESVPGYRVFSNSIDLAELTDQLSVDAAIEKWRKDAATALSVSLI